jgi:hypothetical protein
MRPLPRLAAFIAAGALLLGAATTLSAPASAAVPATLVGTGPAVAHSPQTVTFSYTMDVSDGGTGASFTTHQPLALPANTTGVTFDGAPVPDAQVTQPSAVDIAVALGVLPLSPLLPGTHTLTFTATVNGTAYSSASSTATLRYQSVDTSLVAVMSAPVVTEVNQPDLAVALTPDTGEDMVGFLGTAQDIELAVDVTNAGYGAPTSTLTITLPAGMALGKGGVSRDSDGSPLTCVQGGTPQQIDCSLGALGHSPGGDPTVLIDLTTAPNEPIGSVVPVTVSVAPDAGQGTDTNQANNSVTAQVQYTGSARLTTTITPAKKKVTLGKSTTVTLTVRNDGPQPAPSTIGFAVVVGDQFEITDFSGNTEPPVAAPARVTAHKAQLLDTLPSAGSTPPAAGGASGVLWWVGDIAPGQSVSATLTLRATQLGSSQIALFAVSGAADPNCPNFDCDPTQATLSVVAAVPVAPPASEPVTPPSPASGAVGGLAATGASTRPAVLGGSLLVIGCALLLLGRKRRLS